MVYTMTMERVLRVSYEFEASDNDKAKKKAEEYYAQNVLNPENFDGGDVEHDYVLQDEGSRTIVGWANYK